MTTDGEIEMDRHIGQLFAVGFDGTTVTPAIRALIERFHVGTVLLAAKNLKCRPIGERERRILLCI